MSNVRLSGVSENAKIVAALEAAFDPTTGRYDSRKVRPFRINGKETQGNFIAVNKGMGTHGKEKNLVPMRVNAADTLLAEDYKALDSIVSSVNRERLTVVDDLLALGLRVGLSQTNAMGSSLFQSYKETDEGSAYLSMTGMGDKKNSGVGFEVDSVPLPFTVADAEFPARYLASLSRGVYGTGILSFDGVQDMVEKRTRRIKELQEDMLLGNALDGSGTALAQGTPAFSFAGAGIYGYLNTPYSVSASLGDDWDSTNTNGTWDYSGAQIVEDVTNMKAAMIANKCYSGMEDPRYMIYIPTAYETILDRPYNGANASNITIRDMVMKIAGIKGIKAVDRLGVKKVIMVYMGSQHVRIIDALSPSVLSFEHWTKLQSEYKILALQVPQLRQDAAGNKGIVIAS